MKRSPTVLLLHGIGGARTAFDPQVSALAAGYTAVAWDAPGYGESPDPVAAPGMSGYAKAAAELIGEVGGPAHVVGVSWGGVIATRLALEYPESVRSLVLADSTRGSGRTPAGAAAMLARADELETVGAEEFSRRRAGRLVAESAGESVVEQVRQTMARVRLPGYRYAAESMAETDHSGRLDEIAVPTLVVVGAEDRVTGVAESQVLAAGIPSARLVIVPDAGHAANQERPDEFNRLLLDFLAEVDKSPATIEAGIR